MAVDNPPAFPADQLYAVAARASNDVWAVGQNDSMTEVVHWNGTAWTRGHQPNAAGSSMLTGVAIVGLNNVWAVGNTTTGVTRTLVEHYACP